MSHKTITIHSHPQYWGVDTTDSEARQWATEMAECAMHAGFALECTVGEGTTDVAFCYTAPTESIEGEEIDWFARWATHGFQGMTEWLRAAIAQATA